MIIISFAYLLIVVDCCFDVRSLRRVAYSITTCNSL